jgi:hypothetical protein
MHRFSLVIAAVAIASAITFSEKAAARCDVCDLKNSFDRCESMFADDPKHLAICKIRLVTDADTPLQMASRLNQIEQFEKDRKAERQRDRADCERGLPTCKANVLAELRAEQSRQLREKEFNERCKPTEVVDSNGVRHLQYAQSDCVGQKLN